MNFLNKIFRKRKMPSKLALSIATIVVGMTLNQACQSKEEKERIRVQREAFVKDSLEQKRVKDSISFAKAQEEKRISDSLKREAEKNKNPYPNPDKIENWQVNFDDVELFENITDEKEITDILAVGFDNVIKELNKMPYIKKMIKEKYGGYSKFIKEHYYGQELFPNGLPKEDCFHLVLNFPKMNAKQMVSFLINNNLKKDKFPNYEFSINSSLEDTRFYFGGKEGGVIVDFNIPFSEDKRAKYIEIWLVTDKLDKDVRFTIKNFPFYCTEIGNRYGIESFTKEEAIFEINKAKNYFLKAGVDVHLLLVKREYSDKWGVRISNSFMTGNQKCLGLHVKSDGTIYENSYNPGEILRE